MPFYYDKNKFNSLVECYDAICEPFAINGVYKLFLIHQ